MGLIFNKSTALTESEVIYVYNNVNTNNQAAEFCGIHRTTWDRWAKQYIEPESGKSYHKLLIERNRDLKKKNKNIPSFEAISNYRLSKSIFKILEGEGHYSNVDRLSKKLFYENIVEEKCSECGYNERRLTDYSVPLILVFNDGDNTNQRLENLKYLCYNCYYVLWDELSSKDIKLKSSLKFK